MERAVVSPQRRFEFEKCKSKIFNMAMHPPKSSYDDLIKQNKCSNNAEKLHRVEEKIGDKIGEEQSY